MKIREICLPTEAIGPAPRGACSRPKSSLPASWVSSCKSQGKMKRSGSRREKVHGRTTEWLVKESKVASMVDHCQITLPNKQSQRP
jgi:hypothetical protein